MATMARRDPLCRTSSTPGICETASIAVAGSVARPTIDDSRHQRFEAADVTGGGEQIDRGTAARHRRKHLFRDIGGAPERQATGFDVQRGRCRAQPFIESFAATASAGRRRAPAARSGSVTMPSCWTQAEGFTTRHDTELQQSSVEHRQAGARSHDGEVVAAERDFVQSCLHARADAGLVREPVPSGAPFERR